MVCSPQGSGPSRATGGDLKSSYPRAETDLVDLIEDLTKQMKGAAAELNFEVAARLRDEIADLRQELRGMRAAG